MASLVSHNQRAFLATVTLAILASQVPSCNRGSDSATESSAASNPTGGNGSGGAANGGSLTTAGGSTLSSASTGGNATLSNTGGSLGLAGTPSTTGGSLTNTGGSINTGPGGSDTAGGDAAGSTSQYTVALVQSSKDDAADITQDDINSMVVDAVTQAGGLDFIQDGKTVVLKPNLLTHLAQCWMGTATLPPTVNGVTTDWRVTKAVADLVRTKNPSGQILVMEGSNRNTTAAFAALGYTSDNFGSSVDAFIALEGTSGCANHDQTGLIQKPGMSGTQYWINEQYFNADYVISIGALKTHINEGTTGCVKNLGIGATPNAMYSVSTNNADCTRNLSQSGVASFIDHSTAVNLGTFVADFYSVKPANFAILDGLQGLQNGPCDMTNSASNRMNMRLILASKNAVALDTIEALIMSCDPTKVPALTKAAAYGLGTTDTAQINVVGNKQVADVKKSFQSGVAGVCD